MTDAAHPRRILCVCLGNICRSPMGEGALARAARDAGIAVEIDSAGTGSWHVGKPPHPTGLAVAAARGYDNSHQRARTIQPPDFEEFDLILAMDEQNLATLRHLQPAGSRARLALFDPSGRAVPDPYGNPRAAYEATLDQIEAAAAAWIARLAGPHPGT
ncbi:MAG: low molecular weight protein-tyrosine-phosphatase [Pseudomonadota bacterium]